MLTSKRNFILGLHDGCDFKLKIRKVFVSEVNVEMRWWWLMERTVIGSNDGKGMPKLKTRAVNCDREMFSETLRYCFGCFGVDSRILDLMF